MARFQATQPNGVAVQQLEGLVRTAVFRSARDVVAYLLQQAADRIDAAYQPKPGWQRKARAQLTLDCIFGFFTLERDYYYHPGKQQGHYPADAALGLEGSSTPALARLVCLEGADEASYQKAQEHLKETGGIKVSARQIQRLVQSVGPGAQGPGRQRARRQSQDPDGQPGLRFHAASSRSRRPSHTRSQLNHLRLHHGPD